MDANTNFPDEALRRAGTFLLAGGILLVLGNSLHPLDADPSATSRMELATAGSWLPIHLAVAMGVLGVTVGLVLLGTTTRGRSVASGTVLAVAAIIGGGSLAMVFAALDGFAAASLADRWSATPVVDRAVVESAAVALEAVDSGLAGFGTLVLMGLGMLALANVGRHVGLGAWLRAAASAVGVLGLVTGTVLLDRGPTATTINTLLRPTALGMTLVVLAVGVSLRRRNRGKATTAAESMATVA